MEIEKTDMSRRQTEFCVNCLTFSEVAEAVLDGPCSLESALAAATGEALTSSFRCDATCGGSSVSQSDE